jgi:hypothetical protein
MAEDERLRIIKRTHEGRAITRENGVKMGRKIRLNDVQPTEARQRLVTVSGPDRSAAVALCFGITDTLGLGRVKRSSVKPHIEMVQCRDPFIDAGHETM